MSINKVISLCLLQQIEQVVVEDLVDHIESLFNIKCTIDYRRVDLSFAYMQIRGQYNSTEILKRLKANISDEIRAQIAVVNADLYASGLNFVFGEAEVGGRVSIISLARLKPTFWGEPASIELLKKRARKETSHELGHVMGLRHCNNYRCVMFLSNTLGDTDRKSEKFCSDCAHSLAEILVTF
jgi:archaemetzincin